MELKDIGGISLLLLLLILLDIPSGFPLRQQDFQFFRLPTPGLSRLDRESCLALRCNSSSRAGRAGGSERHAWPWVAGTTPRHRAPADHRKE